jgi:hypothetical protein
MAGVGSSPLGAALPDAVDDRSAEPRLTVDPPQAATVRAAATTKLAAVHEPVVGMARP